MFACDVRFLQCMSDGMMQFEYRKHDMCGILIFNAHRWVMRSLERLNNFLIKSETNPKRARAWDNHQLELKCLDSLGYFDFIIRYIIIDQWLRKFNYDRNMIVIEYGIKRIMTTMIRKRNDFIGILRIWWIKQRGKWEVKKFILCVSRKGIWKIKWSFNEYLILSIIEWWADIRCVKQVINDGCIRGWRYTCEIIDGRFRKETRRLIQKGVIL